MNVMMLMKMNEYNESCFLLEKQPKCVCKTLIYNNFRIWIKMKDLKDCMLD